MIRRIIGIVLGVVAFFIVYWLTGGLATPATPNWALALLVGLVVALIWPWIMGLIIVRRARQRRQNEIDQESRSSSHSSRRTRPLDPAAPASLDHRGVGQKPVST